MNECLYCYIQTLGSLSSRYTTEFFRIILENYQFYKKLFADEYDFNTQYVHDYWSNSIEGMIFRSLEEKENVDEIEKVVLQTLKNPQVVDWFLKRTNADKYAYEIATAIRNGDVEKAFSGYKNQYVRRKRASRKKAFLQNIKNVFRRINK